MATALCMGTDAVDAMFDASADLTFANTDEQLAAVLARKSTAADAFIDTVRLAIELTGGRGYSRSTELERLYRDVRCGGFHPANDALTHEVIGKAVLGILAEVPRW